jgi:hypothetical protein
MCRAWVKISKFEYKVCIQRVLCVVLRNISDSGLSNKRTSGLIRPNVFSRDKSCFKRKLFLETQRRATRRDKRNWKGNNINTIYQAWSGVDKTRSYESHQKFSSVSLSFRPLEKEKNNSAHQHTHTVINT